MAQVKPCVSVQNDHSWIDSQVANNHCDVIIWLQISFELMDHVLSAILIKQQLEFLSSFMTHDSHPKQKQLECVCDALIDHQLVMLQVLAKPAGCTTVSMLVTMLTDLEHINTSCCFFHFPLAWPCCHHFHQDLLLWSLSILVLILQAMMLFLLHFFLGYQPTCTQSTHPWNSAFTFS